MYPPSRWIRLAGGEFLLLGAGTVINPILKIVTTVAVLAATYIFIVKPVLDTTESALDSAGNFASETSDTINQNISSARIEAMRTSLASQMSALSTNWPQAGRELRQCVKKAGRDGPALADCERFADRVRGMQSDRNFATSYATSLRAQGDTGSAARVDQCVKNAGFKPAAMKKCRDLADQLLFG